MAESQTTADELFENALRELSASAFRSIVSSGIRDCNAFLSLDLAALPNVSSQTFTELFRTQQRIRERLDTESISGNVTRSNSEVRSQPAHCSGVGPGCPGVQFPEGIDDGQIFQAIVDSLGARARHALGYGKVRSSAQLVSLDPEVIAGWPNTGARTLKEILEAQRRLQEQISSYHESSEEDDSDHPPTCEKQPVLVDATPVEQPLLPAPQAVRRQIACRVKDPAPWSVLRRTLPRLYGLDDSTVQDLWAAFETETWAHLGLDEPFWTCNDSPPFEWERLEASCIYMDDSLAALLSVTIGYFLRTGVSAESFMRIVEAFRGRVSPWIRDAGFDSESLSDQPIIEGSEIPGVGGLRIDSFDIPEDLARGTQTAGISTWSELEVVSERSIVDSCGFGLTALKLIDLIWSLKSHLRSVRDQLESDLPSDSYTSFHEMMTSLIGSVVSDDRDATVMLGRLAAVSGKKQTLDQLSSTLGVTRERVRQIELKCVPRLRKAITRGSLARFWIAVDEELRPRGVRLTSELASAVGRKFNWAEQPTEDAIAAAVKLLGRFTVDNQAGLVYDTQHRCQQCQSAVDALSRTFAEVKAERSIVDISDHLFSRCRERCDSELEADVSRLADDFVRSVAIRTSGIKVHDGWVYSGLRERGRRGTRAHLVDSIIKAAGRPMHFTEVYQQAKMQLPDDEYVTEHNVYSWIGNSANLVLWDRGTYIHRELVDIPEALIRRIERWMERKLSVGVPFVSVAGAYLAFEVELVEAGVSSESALYSCLRESGSGVLNYPRYPYVVPANGARERVPISIALEQYVLDAGGLVSYQEMRKYAVKDLCIADQMFAVHVYNVPNLVRAGKGLYAHIENLNLDREKITSVVAHATGLVSRDGHVSVEKVYSDKRISCMAMGIDSPEMLYAVLQLNPVGGIQLPGFPQVLSANYENGNGGSRGVINEVADYIALREGPCSFDELEQHFVDELGYNLGTVYNVVIRDNVVRYSRGSLIHLDTIEWENGKQNQLEAEAQGALANARQAGRCYALASDLLEYHRLPNLPDGVVWTLTLLSELLALGGHFAVLGSARNAFVAKPNDAGIGTFEDLAYELLKANYEGACELESFEEDMQAAGIVQKRVTPGMLRDQNKVCISGHLILLKELCGRA